MRTTIFDGLFYFSLGRTHLLHSCYCIWALSHFLTNAIDVDPAIVYVCSIHIVVSVEWAGFVVSLVSLLSAGEMYSMGGTFSILYITGC